MPRPTDDELARRARALARRDPVMRTLVRRHGPPRLRFLPHSSFVSLARAIVFQQLAGSAARAIWGRVETTVGKPFTPTAVMALPDRQLRAAGLSMNKLTALRDLARKVDDGTVPLARLSRMDDEAVIAALTTVRGVGRWTAEMFLLFKLGRPDVWPVTDYGVRKGFMRAYGHAELPQPKALDDEGERFRPHRSLAAWYLWRASEDAEERDADDNSSAR